ncbi:MAG: nucleotidyltransferase domain-containing protein [Paracoccus sp. (in: a-proteobacteria)]|nr:nucleotidyltransferase domain-containing protein [Paracoccus sp. (in: a-proteobacteria)]
MSYMTLESFSKFHGVTPDAILAQLPLNRDGIVVLGGSVVQGHGTRNSDFDVFALIEEERIDETVRRFRNNHPKRANDILAFGSTTLDFQVLSRQALAESFATISAIDFSDPHKSLSFDRLSPHYDNETVGELVHRLRNGIVLQDEVGYRALMDSLDYRAYCLWQARYHTNLGDNVYEDLVGVLAAGDTATASLLTHELLLFGGMSLCFLAGRSVDRKKWVLLTLRNAGPRVAPLATRLEQLLIENKFTPTAIQAAMRLFNEIAEQDSLLEEV